MNSLIEATGGAKVGAVYADPPWPFATYSEKGKGRSPEQHYHVPGSPLDIFMLDVQLRPVLADDCVLFMWVTMPQLRLGLNVMNSWGFDHKTTDFTWVKTNRDGSPFKGLGYWTRANAELCLLGTRGRPQRLARDVGQIVMAPRGRHSAKPTEIRDRITRLVPGPYLELYARERASGWYSWGDQLPAAEAPPQLRAG
jgi:N6-adenosine-specific RNA methylase IME4